ncbi:ATP-binding protein [Kitasatospora sp. NPDC059571]|uniref:ATP-binding protein n=1 Tax=Kitasatospora sp. NPDC059571 TaxID=3346871 RepID=UPI0036C36845
MSLTSLPSGIRLARRITVTVLTTWGIPPSTTVHDAAVLAVTELVTNTVRHAAPRSASFELLLAADDVLDVAVRDSHPGLVDLPAPEAGGGLAVLADLARHFGGALTIEPDPDGGKTIHVLLPLPQPAAGRN